MSQIIPLVITRASIRDINPKLEQQFDKRISRSKRFVIKIFKNGTKNIYVLICGDPNVLEEPGKLIEVFTRKIKLGAIKTKFKNKITTLKIASLKLIGTGQITSTRSYVNLNKVTALSEFQWEDNHKIPEIEKLLKEKLIIKSKRNYRRR